MSKPASACLWCVMLSRSADGTRRHLAADKRWTECRHRHRSGPTGPRPPHTSTRSGQGALSGGGHSCHQNQDPVSHDGLFSPPMAGAGEAGLKFRICAARATPRLASGSKTHVLLHATCALASADMSRLPFELLLALRYLRPKRTFVSIITLISVIGVTLGVAVLIIVISVMSGFDQQLRDRILGFSTHLKVLRVGGTMRNYDDIARRVAENPEVKGVSPFVLGQVLVETQPGEGQSQVSAPWVRGADPLTEGQVSVLPGSIIAGKFDLEGRTLLVGRELARDLRLRVGDRLAVYSPQDLKRMKEGRDKGEDEAILPEDYTVAGIFDVGYYEYNVSVVVTSLENAQELYNLNNSVHGLMVTLDDPYQANAVREQLRPLLGPDYVISLWTEENSVILDALVVEKQVMFYLLFFIMIVAALCILSAQIVFVVQKTREIGMLKALGSTDLQIAVLFLSQSACVAAMGVACGYGLGRLALTYRNEFLAFMRRVTHFELFPAEIYGFTELPALIVPHDIALICGSAFVICVLGGIIPAWTAGRLQPVEALRHE